MSEDPNFRPEFTIRPNAGAALPEPLSAMADVSTTDQGGDGCTECCFRLRATHTAAEPVAGHYAFSIACPIDLSRDFVLMPAALYGGNDFPVAAHPYGRTPDPRTDWAVDAPPRQRDLPRLDHENPVVEQLAGDLAFPCVAVWRAEEKRARVLIGPVGETAGGVAFFADSTAGRVGLTNPGQRRKVFKVDHWTEAERPPPEALPAEFDDAMEVRVLDLPCRDVHELFRIVFDNQAKMLEQVALEDGLPWSEGLRLIQEKTDRFNWCREHGYYAVGLRNDPTQDWQPGWTGGGLNSLSFLHTGSPTSVERSCRTLDYAFGPAQAKSGFCKSIGDGARWYADDPSQTLPTAHLVRKSADLLYFGGKHIDALRTNGHPDIPIPGGWLEGMRRTADAFVRLWQTNGQIGQFVDWETGELLRGGSACGAMTPAALATTARLLDEPAYLEVAREVARHYVEGPLAAGQMNGGPGDILQAIDSESAFALLESLIVLHAHTGEAEWLKAAERCAWQCLSWVAAYDFPFPPNSLFGRLGMRSAGCVFANVQNKHGSPGICTLSGDSLFKLARATEDWRYLEFLRVIAHNSTQYISRPDRRIGEPPLPSGFVNERVNTSDWNEPFGEIFFGSTWAETACALMATELPGIYLRTDHERFWELDHVRLVSWRVSNGQIELTLRNPTAFSAAVRVVAEGQSTAARPWTSAELQMHPILCLGPESEARFTIPGNGA